MKLKKPSQNIILYNLFLKFHIFFNLNFSLPMQLVTIVNKKSHVLPQEHTNFKVFTPQNCRDFSIEFPSGN